MNYLIGFLVFYFGAVIGSFLNVVILRLPNQETLSGRSHCLKCKRQLSVLDLFPIFSFLFLKGKCRTCDNKISPRYLVMELVTGLLFLCRWLFLPPETLVLGIQLLRDWVFIASLVVIFMVDFEYYLILDKVLIGFGVPILVANIVLDILTGQTWDLHRSLVFLGLINGVGFASVFFILWWVSKGRWIGFGDVKLMLLLGMALGWPTTFIAWMTSFFMGTIFSIPLLLLKKKEFSSKLPLGCFLSLASLLALFWGSTWFKWYLAFLGF